MDPRSVPGQTNKKRPLTLALVAGGVLFMCCGGFGVLGVIGKRMKDSTGSEVAEADALWAKGDKAGAVAKYRAIIDNSRTSFLTGDEPARVYGRVIDHEFESGNAEAGRRLMKEALSKEKNPAVTHPEAKQMADAKAAEVREAQEKKLAEAKREEDKKAAAENEKKEKQRQAKLSPEEKLREVDRDKFTAPSLIHGEYEVNEASGDKRYKGKTVLVWGTVTSVEKAPITGSLYINFDNKVFAFLSRSSAKSEEVLTLRKGSLIRLSGTCKGKDRLSGIVTIEDCIFARP